MRQRKYKPIKINVGHSAANPMLSLH